MKRTVTLELEGTAEEINNMLDDLERSICDIANSTEGDCHIYMMNVSESDD